MLLRYRMSMLLAAALVCCAAAHAQQVKSAPGQYDFYVLNLSWAPEFCSTLNTLTPAEQRGGTECTTPHGFVLHGLWPQNFNGTYPGNCGTRPGPTDWNQYLDMTPDLSLLKHEWAKHGTCTTLSADSFFATARRAYNSVHIPPAFQPVSQQQQLAPAAILGLFQRANPSFPPGSFALSCGHNELTAIEACLSRSLQPIACQNVSTCHANMVTVQPETGAAATPHRRHHRARHRASAQT